MRILGDEGATLDGQLRAEEVDRVIRQARDVRRQVARRSKHGASHGRAGYRSEHRKSEIVEPLQTDRLKLALDLFRRWVREEVQTMRDGRIPTERLRVEPAVLVSVVGVDVAVLGNGHLRSEEKRLCEHGLQHRRVRAAVPNEQPVE